VENFTKNNDLNVNIWVPHQKGNDSNFEKYGKTVL